MDMSPQTKKRYNAFEDFPTETGEVKFRPSSGQTTETSIERIERLKPSQMIPDRFQPRRILPTDIRKAFFAGNLNCYEAAEDWLAQAKSDDATQTEINRLMAMGNSFDLHGQIKPITGNWIDLPNGRYVFQIETGERRFWAACLQKVSQKKGEEPDLRVEVIQKPTRQRQVLENRHAEPPSAVEQACEVASLILAESGISPEIDQADDYDYFRQSRSQRMPAGMWDKIIPTMQLTRPRMVQLLNILQLPTPLLDLADRYRLPERVLREVLSLPSAQWERMIRSSIQDQLTSEEVAEVSRIFNPATEHPVSKQKSIPGQSTRDALRNMRRLAKNMDSLSPVAQAQALDAMADSLVVEGRGEQVSRWMESLLRLIQARLKRK
jgi:hypothetical protein